MDGNPLRMERMRLLHAWQLSDIDDVALMRGVGFGVREALADVHPLRILTSPIGTYLRFGYSGPHDDRNTTLTVLRAFRGYCASQQCYAFITPIVDRAIMDAEGLANTFSEVELLVVAKSAMLRMDALRGGGELDYGTAANREYRDPTQEFSALLALILLKSDSALPSTYPMFVEDYTGELQPNETLGEIIRLMYGVRAEQRGGDVD